MSKKILGIGKYLMLLILTVVLGVFGIIYILNYYEQSKTSIDPTVTEPPIIKECVETSNCNPETGESTTTKLFLIKPEDNYNVPSNPYDSDVYNKISKRIILFGDFETINLKINGGLPTEDYHFVSININNESGVYNAARKSSDGLDIQLTSENLGTFTKKSGININIDLLSKITLSTTKAEFLATRQTTKLVRLWDFIKPQPPAPSISQLLVAPFDVSGKYEGKIENMALEYSCKQNLDCGIAVCQNNQLATECLKNSFGDSAMKSWLNWYNENK